MSISYWQDHSKGQIIECDICVIGGGIAGLSAVYWLQKEDPSLKISLIEKGALGSGATGRNAGFITCGSVEHFNRLVCTHGKDKALEIWRFSELNLELLKQEIIEPLNLDLKNYSSTYPQGFVGTNPQGFVGTNPQGLCIGFEQKGSFSLASTEEEFNELKQSHDLMKTMGIKVDVLNENEIKTRLGAENFVGGIKYIDDASVHPIKLIEVIKSRVLKNPNIKVYEHHEVFNVDQLGENKVIHTQHKQFHSPFIVLATNAYSPLLDDYFKDKIYPTRGQILCTEAVPPFMEGPCYANFVLDYFRQLPTGEMIIGGFRQLQKDSEIGYADHTSDVIQNALEEFLDKHIPTVRGKKITHRWSGIMGFSADGQPMIGSLPKDPQVFFSGGFTAHGLGLAFHSGKCLTDLIFDRPIPEFISARRF
ncbi:MAG: FAD-binding oxidoreductase [Bdellovibrionales bacterium]|nr:FAD-binding oxidoreductase [Bdellovibrionales bacterium]